MVFWRDVAHQLDGFPAPPGPAWRGGIWAARPARPQRAPWGAGIGGPVMMFWSSRTIAMVATGVSPSHDGPDSRSATSGAPPRERAPEMSAPLNHRPAGRPVPPFA